MLKRLTLSVLLIFVTSLPMLAGTLTLNSSDDPPYKGFYGSPYDVTIGSTQNLDVYCDDFLDHVKFGQSWQVAVLDFTAAGIAKTRFGSDSDAVDDYEVMAAIVKEANWKNPDYQTALWAVEDPSIEQTSLWDAGAASILFSAESFQYTLGEFSNFYIISPSSGNSRVQAPGQEFLCVASTPEPASVVLMALGIGLLALAGKLRKSHLAA